ncbi:hypothetical protein QMA77_21670 [Pantoea ananatis]|jgi:hypothetical protein|uniref:hypothetical protein n=1 Tax=Pantoea ananas TaxID=553 RepID=UPI0024AE829B|nr:hypothetical protein [Pantoea ananatis]MDI6539537.1 hypothetical protein [Pantoea ananatis]
MSNAKLKEFADEQINISARRILDKGDKADEIAAGKIDFFIALRSVLSGDLDKRELGLLDAVNDTLQHLGIIESGKTFYK